MADRYPLVINPSANQIQEIPSGDNLDVGGAHIKNVTHIDSVGVITATKFVGPMEGTVTGNISGTSGGLSGTPNIIIGSLTAATGTFTGNVSIAGTLTYEDVKNVDSVGLITARNGLAVTGGTATFSGAVDANQGIDVDGQTTLDNANVSGVVTATRFIGDLDAPALDTNSNGIVVTGVATASGGFSGNVTGNVTGNLSGNIIGTRTLGTGVTVTAAGVVSATTYYGSGANLTGIDATQIQTGNTSVQTIDTGSDGHIKLNTEGGERLRILAGGNVNIGGDYSQTSKTFKVTGNSTIDGGLHVTGLLEGGSGFSIVNGNLTLPAYTYHDADADTYYGFSGADQFSVFTAGSERLRVGVAGTVTPGADNTQDLGSSSKRWANVYTGDLHLSNSGSGNSVDGTSGSWTMQEGESDLFLINNNTGKKYKFNLTEVS